MHKFFVRHLESVSRTPPTLLRMRMPYFLVLVSRVGTSLAYACAYRISGKSATL